MFLRTIVCHCLMLAFPNWKGNSVQGLSVDHAKIHNLQMLVCLLSARFCKNECVRSHSTDWDYQTIATQEGTQAVCSSSRENDLAFQRKGGLLHAIAVSSLHRISHFVQTVAVPVSIYRLSTPSEPWRCKTSHAPMREPAQRNGTFGMRHCWWHDTRSWWKSFLHLSSKLGARFYSFPSSRNFKHGWFWIIYHVAPFTM